MDPEMFTQINALLAGQDLLFWAAALALASGGTILVATTFLFLKRRRSRASSRQKSKTTSAPAEQPPSMEKVAPLAPAVAAAQTDLDPALLRRLQETARNLETLRDALRQADAIHGHSPLKVTAPAVEYIFRKGVG